MNQGGRDFPDAVFLFIIAVDEDDRLPGMLVRVEDLVDERIDFTKEFPAFHVLHDDQGFTAVGFVLSKISGHTDERKGDLQAGEFLFEYIHITFGSVEECEAFARVSFLSRPVKAIHLVAAEESQNKILEFNEIWH